MIFEGYASVFGVKDTHGDVVERGAFRQAMRSRSCRHISMGHEHQLAYIGKWETICEDTHGLFVRGRIFDKFSTIGQAIFHKKISGLSIGFFNYKYQFRGIYRHFTAIDLEEISIVFDPACPGAQIINIFS